MARYPKGYGIARPADDSTSARSNRAEQIPDGQGAEGGSSVPEPSTYHVYGRLLSEATNELHGWARQALDDALAGVQREVDHKFAEFLERAYTRGVRDGYVQAVSESASTATAESEKS